MYHCSATRAVQLDGSIHSRLQALQPPQKRRLLRSLTH
jgi:hypothetical protein